MNFRKFTFALTSIVMILLVISGAYTLNYLNSDSDINSKSTFAKVKNELATIKDPVNILVLIVDKTAVNTDSITVMNYNPVTAKISILSIPRDIQVNMRKASKINAVYYNYGVEELINQINVLFNINIRYYIYIDISTFRKVIDVLGGVEYNVPGHLKRDDAAQNLHIDLQKGLQLLDGEHAEQLLRYRHDNYNSIPKDLRNIYDGSDVSRINVQQDFLKQLIKQKANAYYFSRINSILNVIFDNIQETNLNLTDSLRLSKNIGKININNLITFKVIGNDENNGKDYVYRGKISNNTTKETLDGASVVQQYFNSKFSFDGSTVANKKPIINSSDLVPKKKIKKSTKSVTENNPSNSESSFTGKIVPEP